MSATRDTANNILTLAAKNHEKYNTELSQRLLISATATINERERLREALRLAADIDIFGSPKNLAARTAARAALSDQKG